MPDDNPHPTTVDGELKGGESLVIGDVRERRHDAEERRECRQQRQHVVLIGFRPEQLLELLDLLGMLGGEVVRLAEVVR